MKQIAQYLCLFCAVILIASCSEDESDYILLAFPEENPYPEYLGHYGFDQNQIAYVDDNNSYEMGFSFQPLVVGNITALVVSLPDAHANLRITIWDKQAAQPIRTEYVNVATQAQEFVFPIDPLALETNKEYLITMNSDDYYFFVLQQQPEPIVYPHDFGNIRITGARIDMSNSGQIMPAEDSVNAVGGNCSFKFQQIQ